MKPGILCEKNGLTINKKSFLMGGVEFEARRHFEGMPEVWLKKHDDLAFVQGLMHAHERLMQMQLVKVIGAGRVSELLKADRETLEIDVFMRGLGLEAAAKKEIETLSPAALHFLTRYCEGVNCYIETVKPWPFEMRLAGLRPQIWRLQDTLVLLRLMSYIGLAQSQEDLERWIFECLQNDVSLEKLKSLFHPHLADLSDDLLEIYKKVEVAHRVLPKEIRYLGALPKLMASNNFVVSGDRSISKKPLHAFDPHLDVNRLPGVWHEVLFYWQDEFAHGISVPGLPGLCMGRNRNLSFSFTYGFMDTIDFFVEEIRGGQVREGEKFVPLSARSEVISRKGKADLVMNVMQSRNGVVEFPIDLDEVQQNPRGTKKKTEPRAGDWPKVADGFYLSRAWSQLETGASETLEALAGLLVAQKVTQAQSLTRKVLVSCNWLIADQAGNIGYQQSGLAPRRKSSGLFPLLGWEASNSWNGLVPSDELTSHLNPPDGILVTANEDWNRAGHKALINASMGDCRGSRIRKLIQQTSKHNVESLQKIQTDIFSEHAARHLGDWGKYIPKGPLKSILDGWDKKYDKYSVGAVVFEELYREIFRKMFGTDWLGNAWISLQERTPILADFYAHFDRVWLADEPSIYELWFQAKSRRERVENAVRIVEERYQAKEVPLWGDLNQVWMRNIFFQGKWPRFLNFFIPLDYGPIEIEGGRGTVVQGAVFESHGRVGTFSPSFRFVCDHAENESYTVLMGGSSDRFSSVFYRNQVKMLLKNKYKKVSYLF